MEYIPLLLATYPGLDPDSIWRLDEDQFLYLAAAADPLGGPIARARMAMSPPAMIGEKGMRAITEAAPKIRVEGEESLSWWQDEYRDKGLVPPKEI